MEIGLPSVEKLRAYLKRKLNRGTFKSPSLYFGAFLIILIMLLVFGNDLSDKKPLDNDSSRSFYQNLFLSQTKSALSQSPQLLLVQNSGLMEAAPPETITPQSLGALFLISEPQAQRQVITEYIVEPGDTLFSLAEEFNISVDTLIWANNLAKNSVLKIGQKLIVLPVSGVIHHVKDKDTVSSIAKTYKGKAEEILAFNELSEQGHIYIGDIVIVPGGVMPTKTGSSPSPVNQPLADSYFICPTASCRQSQGLHWYNAIDFDGTCGDTLRAAAAGKVLKTALTNSTSRYAFGGAGNHITILHPNGVVTMYGHIAKSFVSQGEQVSQGQTIALMGGAPGTAGVGMSTGCHLHFGVTGAKNPFSR